MKEKFGLPGVLGALVLVFLLFGLVLTAVNAWPALGGANGATWAAWVQAIGSVAALFVTGGLAVWEARRRRLEGTERVADQLRSRLAVLEFTLSSADSFLSDQKSDARNTYPYAVAAYEAFKNALKVSDLVTVLDMPSKESVNAYFVFTAAVAVFRDAIAKNDGLWLSESDINKLGFAFEGMANVVIAIKDEADKIAGAE